MLQTRKRHKSRGGFGLPPVVLRKKNRPVWPPSGGGMQHMEPQKKNRTQKNTKNAKEAKKTRKLHIKPFRSSKRYKLLQERTGEKNYRRQGKFSFLNKNMHLLTKKNAKKNRDLTDYFWSRGKIGGKLGILSKIPSGKIEKSPEKKHTHKKRLCPPLSWNPLSLVPGTWLLPARCWVSDLSVQKITRFGLIPPFFASSLGIHPRTFADTRGGGRPSKRKKWTAKLNNKSDNFENGGTRKSWSIHCYSWCFWET